MAADLHQNPATDPTDQNDPKESNGHTTTTIPSASIASDDFWAVAYTLAHGCEIIDVLAHKNGMLTFVLDDAGGRASSAMRSYLYGSPRANVHEMKRCVQVVRGVIWDPMVR